MQLHYPTLLPDESLYSLAARFARLNGYWNHLSAIRDLMGSAKATSVADCTVSYKDSSLENLNLYGDAQYIQETLTTKLLALHLGWQVSSAESQLIRHPDDSCETFLESVYGSNPSWRDCQECANRNLKLYGVKYWQRAHQLPSSIVCHYHGIALTECNLPRKRLHDHLWMLSEAPIKPKDNGTNLSAHWKMIAQIGHDGLQDTTEPNTSDVIKRAVLMALRNKGLVTNLNRIILRKYSDTFDEFFGANFKHEMRSEVGIKTPTALLKGITNEFNANTLYRIILVYWLFGSWGFFKESCKWIGVFKYPENLKSFNSDDEFTIDEYLLYKAKEVSLRYMFESINPTRNEFIKNHYRDFNWLLRHDRAWLDQMLPITRTWKQINIF